LALLSESAAWLLEKRVVRALGSLVQPAAARIFPYEVAAALGRHMAPDLEGDGLIASVLAALQDSDAPAALPQCVTIARDAAADGGDPVMALRSTIQAGLSNGDSTLEAHFKSLEREFDGDGIMAVAMRRIIAAARHALEMRKADPLFELAMVEEIANGVSPHDILQRIPSCALVQEGPGPIDELQRDVLISFLPVETGTGRDPEDGLRTVHAIFDFVSRHLAPAGFVATENANRRPCPFFTCCNLQLRVDEPHICRSQPWLAADWQGWGADGRCWYGTAVSVTRPPAPSAEPGRTS
jgi:hypothetical protein